MDQVLAAIGAFFGELKARDWLTAGIAALALLVSWRAFVRAGKVIPRARFRVVWPDKLDNLSTNGVALVTVSVENFGGDGARHVTVTATTLKQENGVVFDYPLVEPSKGSGWSLPIPLENARKNGQWVHTDEGAKRRRPLVVVRWRRENSSWRWRRICSRAPEYDAKGLRV